MASQSARSPEFRAPETARPPLLAACEAGELDEVAKLLAGGADPNQRTDEHWTPLIMGAKEGHLAIVNLLLEKGATPRPPDGARHTPLRGAAMFGHVEVVRRLLDARADVNQPSVDAKTALMGAAMNGKPAVVELLLVARRRQIAAQRVEGDGVSARRDESRLPRTGTTSARDSSRRFSSE